MPQNNKDRTENTIAERFVTVTKDKKYQLRLNTGKYTNTKSKKK